MLDTKEGCAWPQRTCSRITAKHAVKKNIAFLSEASAKFASRVWPSGAGERTTFEVRGQLVAVVAFDALVLGCCG